MKKLLPFLLLILSFYSLKAQNSWTLVYHNDENGNRIEGNIEDLIQAIRDGQEIRMAWWSSRVEHLADAAFLTILQDSVVTGQIRPIYGQTPDLTDYSITLKENLEWVLIGGTNGISDAMMSNKVTGEIIGHNRRNRAFKWYVRR